MTMQTTTWRFLYENMPDGTIEILLGDGNFYPLEVCKTSHIDQHGRLLGDGDTIYWAIEGGEYKDSPIENKVTWRYIPTAPDEPDDNACSYCGELYCTCDQPPCSYCGEYCRRDPVDCEDAGGGRFSND